MWAARAAANQWRPAQQRCLLIIKQRAVATDSQTQPVERQQPLAGKQAHKLMTTAADMPAARVSRVWISAERSRAGRAVVARQSSEKWQAAVRQLGSAFLQAVLLLLLLRPSTERAATKQVKTRWQPLHPPHQRAPASPAVPRTRQSLPQTRRSQSAGRQARGVWWAGD